MKLNDEDVKLMNCKLLTNDNQQDLSSFELISVQERLNDNLLVVRKNVQLDV